MCAYMIAISQIPSSTILVACLLYTLLMHRKALVVHSLFIKLSENIPVIHEKSFIQQNKLE